MPPYGYKKEDIMFLKDEPDILMMPIDICLGGSMYDRAVSKFYFVPRSRFALSFKQKEDAVQFVVDTHGVMRNEAIQICDEWITKCQNTNNPYLKDKAWINLPVMYRQFDDAVYKLWQLDCTNVRRVKFIER